MLPRDDTFFAADCYKKNLFASVDKKWRIMKQSLSANHIAVGRFSEPSHKFFFMGCLGRLGDASLPDVFLPRFSSLQQSCARFPPRSVDTESAANSDREW